jgi:hypothetical protein
MGATEVSTMPFICGDVIGAGSGGTGGTDASKDTTPQLGDLMAKEKPLIVVRWVDVVGLIYRVSAYITVFSAHMQAALDCISVS